MSEIDQIEFGKLVQQVSSLVERMDIVTTRVECISQQMTKGKGIFAGMLIAAGGLGAGATHALDRLFK